MLISSLWASMYARSHSGGSLSWYRAATWSPVSQSRRPSGAARRAQGRVQRRTRHRRRVLEPCPPGAAQDTEQDLRLTDTVNRVPELCEATEQGLTAF